jgi:hypothetical protein
MERAASRTHSWCQSGGGGTGSGAVRLRNGDRSDADSCDRVAAVGCARPGAWWDGRSVGPYRDGRSARRWMGAGRALLHGCWCRRSRTDPLRSVGARSAGPPSRKRFEHRYHRRLPRFPCRAPGRGLGVRGNVASRGARVPGDSEPHARGAWWARAQSLSIGGNGSAKVATTITWSAGLYGASDSYQRGQR